MFPFFIWVGEEQYDPEVEEGSAIMAGEQSLENTKTEVLLLANLFKNFREQCLKAYDLDPVHCYKSPGLT